jgi:hypothetical protein
MAFFKVDLMYKRMCHLYLGARDLSFTRLCLTPLTEVSQLHRRLLSQLDVNAIVEHVKVSHKRV